MKIFRAAVLIFIALPAAAQDWVAGIEATSGATYSYLTHYSRNGDYTVWQTLSLLTYRSRDDGGTEVRVNSPGVAAGISRRWNFSSTSLGLGTGYEVRWTERRGTGAADFRETEQGPLIEGDVVQRFTPRLSGRVGGRWSGANDWIAASAEAGYIVMRGIRVGPQILWHGNEDIRVRSTGGFIEIPLGRSVMRSALQIRGGQARIEHADGTTDSEPYFSAGIVIPFR